MLSIVLYIIALLLTKNVGADMKFLGFCLVIIATAVEFGFAYRGRSNEE